ncbi:radical SAM protein [Candidatus Woesearchaeota archaeon]|nr:radical SAM protein [Candidatus Woesearchaeota archaeon]
MESETALAKYEKMLMEGNLHIYLTNSCYDRCAHCYMNAVPEKSHRARHINPDDLIHFANLLRQDKPRGLNIALSGGDPLLHPDIVPILDSLSEHSSLEILTSGFALSNRNANRKELLLALARCNGAFAVASPEEPYHSITWETISDIRKYIKEQGFSPRKFGYPSRTIDLAQKALLALNPIGLAVMGAGCLLNKLSANEKPKAMPIGRGQNLPKEQQLSGTSNCELFENINTIYVGYGGQLQYCIYTCHDGFMNISELRDVSTKEEAIKLILQRLREDLTFQDITQHGRCYFSKKIRKKAIADQPVKQKEQLTI